MGRCEEPGNGSIHPASTEAVIYSGWLLRRPLRFARQRALGFSVEVMQPSVARR